MPNDVPGILSWLVVVGLKKTWDQKRSSGMLLTFTVTFLFQFRFAVTEQYCLFTQTFFERVETYHYERHVRAMVLGFCLVIFGSFSSPSNSVVSQTRAFSHLDSSTLSQGSIDELASDGKTAPKAALTRSSTFRIECGDDGFQPVSLNLPQQSSTCDLQRARTEVPRVSYTGDNFAGMSSILTKCLFGEMPQQQQLR